MDNRVYIGEKIKSKIHKNFSKEYKEKFIGGFRTLTNEKFLEKSAPYNNWNIVKIEKQLMEDEEQIFHSTGNTTGVMHIFSWNNQYKCFLGWKLTPRVYGGMSVNKLGQPLEESA